MGTNYTLVYPTTESVECHCCGHVSQKQKTYHLGKSSWGWCFSLHVSPELGLNTFDDVFAEILSSEGYIENEYGDKVELGEFVSIVKERSSPKSFDERDWWAFSYTSEYDFHYKNHSLRGPNNLLRHKVDGVHCIGHGEGTWDYITGEFC